MKKLSSATHHRLSFPILSFSIFYRYLRNYLYFPYDQTLDQITKSKIGACIQKRCNAVFSSSNPMQKYFYEKIIYDEKLISVSG